MIWTSFDMIGVKYEGRETFILYNVIKRIHVCFPLLKEAKRIEYKHFTSNSDVIFTESYLI